jgi:hypothetical protein
MELATDVDEGAAFGSRVAQQTAQTLTGLLPNPKLGGKSVLLGLQHNALLHTASPQTLQ